MVPNYNLTDQVAQLQSQLAQLNQFQQQQQYIPQVYTPQAPTMPTRSELKRVNGIEGAIEEDPDEETAINAVYDVLNEREVEWENSVRMYHSTYR